MLSSRPLGDPWVAWADHCVRPKSNVPFKTTHKEIEKKNDIQELYPQTRGFIFSRPKAFGAKKLWPDSRLRSPDEFCFGHVAAIHGHRGDQESMVLWFYVLSYSVWIQFRLNFL